MVTGPNLPTIQRESKSLPITRGRLLDFSDNPFTCMRRLYRTHGTIAALEEQGQRLVFIFGPQYNQQVLSDAKTFHSRFFVIRGPKNSAHRDRKSTRLNSSH